MLRRRIPSSILMIAVLLPLLLLGACFPVPLGDPEKATADPRYVGAWLWDSEDAKHMVLIRPWDTRTYIVLLLTVDSDPDEGESAYSEIVLKGWLTEVKGNVFLSLEDVRAMARPSREEKNNKYWALKLNLAGDVLTATGLNPSFPPFEAVPSSAELERLVNEHWDNPQMWATPIQAQRASQAEREAFDKLAVRAATRPVR